MGCGGFAAVQEPTPKTKKASIAVWIRNVFLICVHLRPSAVSLICVKNLKTTLLVEGDLPELELDDERVLVALLIQTMAEFVQNLKRTADDRVRLLLARIGIGPSGVKVRLAICVHLRLNSSKQKRPGRVV